MQPFPHHYRAAIELEADDGDVVLRSPGLPELRTAPPAEYGGPGDRWSPETLLVGAVADCYVLGFRAIAAASKLEWSALSCEVEGTLEKVEKRVRFTRIAIRATVTVPPAVASSAERILHKAEEVCLVTNSLSASTEFSGSVRH